MMNQYMDFHGAEMEALMTLLEPELKTVRKGLDDVHDAYNSGFMTTSSSDAALNMLGALAETAEAANAARRSLAVALLVRGTQTTTVAKAAGVSRITVNRWRKTDLQDD